MDHLKKKKYNESDDFKNDNLAKCHTSYNVSITNWVGFE